MILSSSKTFLPTPDMRLDPLHTHMSDLFVSLSELPFIFISYLAIPLSAGLSLSKTSSMLESSPKRGVLYKNILQILVSQNQGRLQPSSESIMSRTTSPRGHSNFNLEKGDRAGCIYKGSLMLDFRPCAYLKLFALQNPALHIPLSF